MLHNDLSYSGPLVQVEQTEPNSRVGQLPAISRKALLIKSSEHTKKYKQPITPTSFRTVTATVLAICFAVLSANVVKKIFMQMVQVKTGGQRL